MTGDAAQVAVQRRGAVVVATVTGEIDIHNAHAVGARLQAAVATGAHALVLDLSGLEFLDSTAIHGMFGLARLLREHRQGFGVVVRPGGPVQRTLGLVEFQRAAPLGDDVDALVAQLG